MLMIFYILNDIKQFYSKLFLCKQITDIGKEKGTLVSIYDYLGINFGKKELENRSILTMMTNPNKMHIVIASNLAFFSTFTSNLANM